MGTALAVQTWAGVCLHSQHSRRKLGKPTFPVLVEMWLRGFVAQQSSQLYAMFSEGATVTAKRI